MAQVIEAFSGTKDKPTCSKCRGNHYVLKEGLDRSKKDLHLDQNNFINCSSCIDNSKNAS